MGNIFYKMFRLLLTISFSIFSLGLYASCFNPTYTITEILNHAPDSHHIFSCEILHSFPEGFGFESMAVLIQKYRGNPNDTIYINTGGGTTQFLLPNWSAHKNEPRVNYGMGTELVFGPLMKKMVLS